MSRRALRRLGLALVALGVAGILWGVVHVLEAARAGETRRTFEERPRYDEVKERVHGSFLAGLVRALGGLGIAWIGSRVLASAGRDGGTSAGGDPPA